MAPGASVILMIADGLGFNGWLAADLYEHGVPGRQVYQRPRTNAPFAHVAKAQTELLPSGERHPDGATDRWPAASPYRGTIDSAAAATAMLSGQWVPNGALNVDRMGRVSEPLGRLAVARGMGAGVVTSVQAAHATPAAAAVQVGNRTDTEAIFRQLLASGLHVVAGCGHPRHDDDGRLRHDADHAWVGGPATWNALTRGATGHALVQDRAAFEAVARGERVPERWVGVARSATTLQQRREGVSDLRRPSGRARNPEVPTLATMAGAALHTLGRHREFFLLVEGGAVDWSNHDNDLPRMLEEQTDFNRAVEAVVRWIETERGWDRTLLIVTSDHETGGIRGAAGHLPDARGKGVLPGARYTTPDHTTDLVPLWAIGAGADRFRRQAWADPLAAALWGEPFDWRGGVVAATDVHTVMRDALARHAPRTAPRRRQRVDAHLMV